MPYNFVTDSFTQINFVEDFLQAKCDFRAKRPFRGSFVATYDVHRRFIGKWVVDFLLVLIELLLLGVTAEALRSSKYRFKIGDFVLVGAGWPKISGRRGRHHQPFPLLPPCPFTSSSFPLSTFPFLSLALLIFFFLICPSLPFLYQNSHTPFQGRRS